jgi:ABC-type glycerol-3-phosphate transport system permease component
MLDATVTDPRAERQSPPQRQRGLGRREGKLARDAATYVILIGGAIVMLFPFFWMVVTSLKPLAETRLYPPTILPRDLTFSNYTEIFHQYPFGAFLLNGFIIATAVTIGTLLSCTLAAYAMARLQFPGRVLLFYVVLGTLMLPYSARMIPLFVEMTKLGWINSFKPLIVPAFFGSAYGIFLLRQFFLGIPRELAEAATLDGCGPLRVLWHVYVPLSKPAFAALGVVTFVAAWNDLLPPLIFINSPEKMPIAVGLSFFKGQGEALWSFLMAASVLAVAPLLLIYVLAQRFIVEGMTFTGIKR